MHARPDRTTNFRRAVAALAAVGAVTAAMASLLPWVGTDTEDGGTTSITGWGSISGTSSISGTNLNDVMDSWTYRPGLVGLIFGSIGAIAAISLATNAGRNTRPHRITAAVLTLCGLVCLGWGVLRGVTPGDAGVFEAGETYPEIGPWVTAVGGAAMLAAAVLVFAGRIDPPLPAARRGIQPR
jgi:hypothetical protein